MADDDQDDTGREGDGESRDGDMNSILRRAVLALSDALPAADDDTDTAGLEGLDDQERAAVLAVRAARAAQGDDDQDDGDGEDDDASRAPSVNVNELIRDQRRALSGRARAARRAATTGRG